MHKEGQAKLKPLSSREFEIYLAQFLFMEIQRKNKIKQHWSSTWKAFPQKLLGRDRWMIIFRKFKCDLPWLVEQVRSNFKNHITLGSTVTIDEVLAAYTGRCKYIAYIPRKDEVNGLLYYELCAPLQHTQKSYLVDVYPWIQGRQPSATKVLDVFTSDLTSGTTAVMDAFFLCKGIENISES